MAKSTDHSDEEYNSASDEDFNPDAPALEENLDSSDDEGAYGVLSKRREKLNEADDIGFENSGDEATISKGHKNKRKLNDVNGPDEEGGEGRLIKTRSQRQQEKKQKRPLASVAQSSVDIDALWAQMSGPDKSNKKDQMAPGSGTTSQDEESSQNRVPTAKPKLAHHSSIPVAREMGVDASVSSPNTITIKRMYEFAGQKMEEEHAVPADSAEARLYQEQQLEKQQPHSQVLKKPGVRRPTKRKSIFDATTALTDTSQSKSGPKLNTLEKSKLDWAQHIDNEGLSEELDDHRRGKDTYLGRMDFLGRMDAKREDDIKKTTFK